MAHAHQLLAPSYSPDTGAFTSIMARFPPAFLGVVSVGRAAGGVISSAFCLLYKLYTLKLTKKQVSHC